MAYQWFAHGTPADAAEALAEAVANKLQAVLSKKDQATLALSGGRSPIAFFEKLSQKDLDWSKVALTLVDERIVPFGHVDSNTSLVQQHLLQNKAAIATWIPMIEAGAEASELSPDNALNTALKHYQQPDVLVLGMGDDGHTASLFPKAPQLEQGLDLNNQTPLLHTSPVAAPHERISMTLAAILKTPSLFLAIQGEKKKHVFDEAAKGLNKEFPISYILDQQKADCHVYYSK